jgi:hypothetical protein
MWSLQEGVWRGGEGLSAVGKGGTAKSRKKGAAEPGHTRGWLHFKLVFEEKPEKEVPRGIWVLIFGSAQ